MREKKKKKVFLGGVGPKTATSTFSYDFSLLKSSLYSLRRFIKDKHSKKQSNKIITDYTDTMPNIGLDAIKSTGSRPAYSALLIIVGFGFGFLIIFNMFSVFGQALYTKDTLMIQARTGFESVVSATDNLMSIDLATAQENFNHAKTNFSGALSTVDDLSGGISLWKGSPFDTSNNVLTAGDELSDAGILATKALSSIIEDQELNRGLEFADLSISHTQNAYNNLRNVSLSQVPVEYRETFVDSLEKLDSIQPTLTSFQEDIPELKRMFGEDYPRRYFIAFQNTYESRGMGGFMGSYGILDMEEGQVTSFEVHDVYDVDWQLFEDVSAPYGLERYMDTVKLRDANYLPDTQKAAEYIRWFYEHSDGTSFDGLIVIDQIWLQKALELTGPIEIAEYDTTLSSENYFEILQYVIETSKEDEDGPKNILKLLAPELVTRLNEEVDHNLAVAYGLELLRDKHLSIYMLEPDLQEVCESWNLTQSMYTAPYAQDYFSPIHTNMGGNKNDRWISEAYEHKTMIAGDGTITNTVTVSLSHTFDTDKRDEIYRLLPQLSRESRAEQERLLFIFGDSPYVDYLRLYVPEGSTLVDTTNINDNDIIVKSELDKTVLGIHTVVEQGATKTFSVTYTLPFTYDQAMNDTHTYELIAQKQFGRAPGTIKKTLTLDESMTFHSTTPDMIPENNTQSVDIRFVHDQYYAEQFEYL